MHALIPVGETDAAQLDQRGVEARAPGIDEPHPGQEEIEDRGPAREGEKEIVVLVRLGQPDLEATPQRGIELLRVGLGQAAVLVGHAAASLAESNAPGLYPGGPHGYATSMARRSAMGRLYITRLRPAVDPVRAEYLLTFGSPITSEVNLNLGSVRGLDTLTDLLRAARVPIGEIERAWSALVSDTVHEIAGVTLTPAAIRILGL